MEDREAIRRAYFVEHKSIRAIARELHHGRDVIREALASAEPRRYTLTTPRPAPQLDAFKARMAAGQKRRRAAQAALHGPQDLPASAG